MKVRFFLIALLIISIGVNFFLWGKSMSQTKKETNLGDGNNQYRLVNPLVSIPIDSNDSKQDGLILHYNDLKPQIEKTLGDFNGKKQIGFFLQDAKTGAWLGYNEKEGFVPASLLKVPIMMAILKKVEREEIKLNDQLTIEQEDLDSNAGKLYEKGAGTKMTYWDLIEEMILNSDNTAKNVLKKDLSEAEINAVFTHVGIENPYLKENGQVVTPRGYSRLFKSLYFATFLNPELSEKALDITTDTSMENLISAGIPPEVQIAHKFSERPDVLSDCGLIYESKNPYFLCVMTKNIELTQAKELIKSLSEIVYRFISKK
jgi:beta-lactamase class A